MAWGMERTVEYLGGDYVLLDYPSFHQIMINYFSYVDHMYDNATDERDKQYWKTLRERFEKDTERVWRHHINLPEEEMKTL